MNFRFLPVAACCALLLACPGGPGSEPPPGPGPGPAALTCTHAIESGGDGVVDCSDPACAEEPACLPPPPPPCLTQRDCQSDQDPGDLDGVRPRICHQQKCVAPGPHDREGDPRRLLVPLELTFDPALRAEDRRPPQVLLRLLDPRQADGATLTCEELHRLAADEATSTARLDNAPVLNHLLRRTVELRWEENGEATGVFRLPAEELPRGDGLLLLAEAFSNPAEGEPAGIREAIRCEEGIDLAAASPELVPVRFPAETECDDGADDDRDGRSDCDDADCREDPACVPPAGPSCESQRDCGDVLLADMVRTCLGGRCVPPGRHNENGQTRLVSIGFDLAFDPRFSQAQQDGKPKSALIRLVHPELIGGGKLTCAELKARAGRTEATRRQLDRDPEINQAFRHLIPLSWPGTSSGEKVFNVPSFRVPRAKRLILYSEAWYGVRELTEPTGSLASVDCVEGIDLGFVPDETRLRVTFRP